MAFLEVKDIQVFYGKACSLNHVSVRVEKGAVVGIIGPNGAGKSTLLDSIIGLTDCRGEIIFDGTNLGQLTSTEIVRLGIGYAPERRNLFPFMGVKENLLVGAYCARKEMETNLKMVYEMFPILEKRQNQESRTMSGGELQMLSLGRAVMSNPKLLMVDEPTLGLAPLVCLEISRVLMDLRARNGIAILITEQNVNFALRLSEEIYLLETGKVKMKGVPEELKKETYIKETYFGV
jgi:branched-chain amino acid transport system ATP-binding protein